MGVRSPSRAKRRGLAALVACAAVLAAGPLLGASIPGTITEFPLSFDDNPFGIVTGPDGAMWFVATDQNFVGRMTTDGVITNKFTVGNQPNDITVGPDHNLWITEESQGPTGGNAIGRLTPSGTFTAFPLPNPLSGAQGIVAGPDNRLWFTEFMGNRVGSIDPFAPNPATTIQEYPLSAGTAPILITVGPDRLIWFTEELSSHLAHIDPTNPTTSLVEIALPPGHVNPTGITTGPDGAMWFTVQNSHEIGRVPTTGSAFTFYPTPTPTADPFGIVTGPDGALWFTETDSTPAGFAGIGRITTSGVASDQALAQFAFPLQITNGPGQTLWFTDASTPSPNIGRISAIGASPPPPAPVPIVPRFTG